MGEPWPAELVLPDKPDVWRALGFAVTAEGSLELPGFRVVFAGGATPSVPSLGFAGLTDASAVKEVQGLPVHAVRSPPSTCTANSNGVTGLDHIVLRTSNWRQLLELFQRIGLKPRREWSMPKRSLHVLFFRSRQQPSPILEIVAPTEASGTEGQLELQGLSFSCSDLERTHQVLKEQTKPPWKAVQPGRFITTLQSHKDRGISVPVAFMSAHGRAKDPKSEEDQGPPRSSL